MFVIVISRWSKRQRAESKRGTTKRKVGLNKIHGPIDTVNQDPKVIQVEDSKVIVLFRNINGTGVLQV